MPELKTWFHWASHTANIKNPTGYTLFTRHCNPTEGWCRVPKADVAQIGAQEQISLHTATEAKPFSHGAQSYGGHRGNLQIVELWGFLKKCFNSSSTWQSWLSNFGLGWDFPKQERVLVLWLGAAEGSNAKVVNLGFVFPADIKISPEPLYFSGPFWGTKAKQKQSPKKTETICLSLEDLCLERKDLLVPLLERVFRVCFFGDSSLSSALPLLMFVIHALSFLLFQPTKLSSSLERSSHSSNHFLDEGTNAWSPSRTLL